MFRQYTDNISRSVCGSSGKTQKLIDYNTIHIPKTKINFISWQKILDIKRFRNYSCLYMKINNNKRR